MLEEKFMLFKTKHFVAFVYPTIIFRLEPILSPYLQELDTVSNQAPTPHSKPKVDFIFKLLTMLIQSLEPPQNEENGAGGGGGLKTNLPVQVLFPQIYPIIKRVAEKWFQDADVIECMCNLLNQCVQTLQVQQNLVAPKWQLLAA